MPLHLYDLPNWLFGLLVTGAWVVVGLGGYMIFQRVCRVQFADEQKTLAIALLSVLATVNSLLLAFTAVSVWESFGLADQAVRGEAVTISSLARDLAVFDTEQSHQARDLLKLYARTVVAEEWPHMRSGHPDDDALAALDGMFRVVGAIRPAQPREEALMPEIWARANELIKHRRERLYAGGAQVPDTLWVVVILGTLLTIMTTYVLPRNAFHLATTAVLSGSMGLVFFFVAAMDRPFAGKESIGPEPIELSLRRMEQWDQETRRLRSASAKASR